MKINVGKSVAVNLQFWHKGGGTDYKKIKVLKLIRLRIKMGKMLQEVLLRQIVMVKLI